MLGIWADLKLFIRNVEKNFKKAKLLFKLSKELMFWYQNWIFVKNLHFFEYQLDAIQFDLRYLTTLFFPSYYNTIYLSIYRSLFLILSTYFFPSTCDFPPTSANLAWGKKEKQFKNPNKEIKTWKKKPLKIVCFIWFS